MARANAEHCVRLCDAVAPMRPSSRLMAELYVTYAHGNAKTRELVMTRPELVLKARAEAITASGAEPTPAVALLGDARAIAAIARRAMSRLVGGALDGASEGERDDVSGAMTEARAEVDRLADRFAKETSHAR